jgi:hypothetical protein
MADDMIRRLAGEQRRRFIAGMLGAAESSTWWSKLNTTEQRSYRERVMTSVGTYHDFMLDVIKVTHDDDSIRNERAIELIQQVHASQARLERTMTKA